MQYIFVLPVYVEREGEPFIIEMGAKLDDFTQFGFPEKSSFIRKIERYTKEVFSNALTGVRNRRYYEEQIRGLKCDNGLIMPDVDYFKKINDTHGHAAGDRVLCEIARKCVECLRKDDFVIRMG